MDSEISPKLRELLNSVVGRQIDNYNVKVFEDMLQGENFLGEIIFVTLENKKTLASVHLVVKKALANLDQAGFFSNVYTREIYFYEHIWPLLNMIQESHSLGFNKVPKCYTNSKTHGEENLVMEDLSKQNFRIFNKIKTFDRNHLELIFKSYGIFHAISVAFKEEYPEKFAEIVTTLGEYEYKGGNAEQDLAFRTNTDNSIDYVRKLFDENKDRDICAAIDNFKKNPYQIYEDISAYKDTSMIIHGDCWSNNMMFKYDENGLVEDMKFLDFQMIAVGTPVQDLSYCLYSGASKDVLDKLDDLLTIYFNSFSDTLKRLNCQPENPYTYDKLKTEWKRFCTFGYLVGLILWRLKLVDKKHIPKIEDNSVATLCPIAEEYQEEFDKRLKDLTIHFYDREFF